MPGSIDYTPGPTQLALNATVVGVFLYDVSQDNGNRYTLLPNIRCEQIQYKEGSEPPSARFSYILDELAGANGWPNQFDQIWSLAVAPSPYLVGCDDHLVVLALLPDNTTRVLFHGFARIPQTDLTAASQAVTFVAVGVAIRCWDTPIGGTSPAERRRSSERCRRDDGPAVPVQSGRQRSEGDRRFLAQLHARRLRRQRGRRQPVPCLPRPQHRPRPGPAHLLGPFQGGPDHFGDLQYAERTTRWSTTRISAYSTHCSRIAGRWTGSEFYDPSNPATYQTDSNVIRDYDATNQAWPVVVAELLGFHGFGMRWVCEDDQYGQPYDYLEIYRKDAAGPTSPKPVFLPATGSDLASSAVNLAAFHAAFDFQSVANQIVVETKPKRYEVSVILAPGFQPATTDSTAANRGQFRKSFIDVADTLLSRLGSRDPGQVSALPRRRVRRRTLELRSSPVDHDSRRPQRDLPGEPGWLGKLRPPLSARRKHPADQGLEQPSQERPARALPRLRRSRSPVRLGRHRHLANDQRRLADPGG